MPRLDVNKCYHNLVLRVSFLFLPAITIACTQFSNIDRTALQISVSEHRVVDQPDVCVLPRRADRRLAHRLLLGRGLPPQGGQVGPAQVPL